MRCLGVARFPRLTQLAYHSLIGRKSFLYKFSLQTRGISTPSTQSTTALTEQTTHEPITPPADHRNVGVQQQLFATSIHSPGSPLFLPNGAHIFNVLVSFLRTQHVLFGFQEVITPTIYKRSLWEQSGHWDHYSDDMFEVTGRGARGQKSKESTTSRVKDRAEIGEDEEYGLKPMNCPGHCLLFRTATRSYRELPIRYADFSALHRNERSGALSGLTRVRRFHQDDGHIFCQPSQVSQEILSTLKFIAMVYKTFHLPPFKLVLSTKPEEKFVGDAKTWEEAEEALRVALDQSGQEWTTDDGAGAFYGPKIDIILKDSDGKKHQTATIQLDFQLPQRFDLQYQTSAGESATAVIIHRAIFGSLERFMALLIEHYNGRWPFWLSPRQAIILTVGRAESFEDYLAGTSMQLRGQHLSGTDQDGTLLPRPLYSPTFLVDVDDAPTSLKRKIALAKSKGYTFVIVIGAQEAKDQSLVVDITAHARQEPVRKILSTVVDPDSIGDGRSVRLAPEQAYRFFCRLSQAYE